MVKRDIGRLFIIRVRLKTILSVVFEAVVAHDVICTGENSRPLIVDYRVIGYRPIQSAVVVYDALVVRRDKVPDSQIFDSNVGGASSEGGLVYVLTVHDCSRSTNICRAIARLDLAELVGAERVYTGSKPKCFIGSA